jgi:hypothetical protein
LVAEYHWREYPGPSIIVRTPLFQFITRTLVEVLLKAVLFDDRANGYPLAPPALLAMVTLLQAYRGASGGEAVMAAVMTGTGSRCWTARTRRSAHARCMGGGDTMAIWLHAVSYERLNPFCGAFPRAFYA